MLYALEFDSKEWRELIKEARSVVAQGGNPTLCLEEFYKTKYLLPDDLALAAAYRMVEYLQGNP